MTIPVLCEVKSYYWSCGNKAHRHRTEEIASRCNLKSSRRSIQRRWTDTSYAECQTMADAGMSLTAIAKHYSLSRERIRQVLGQWSRIKSKREWLAANPGTSAIDFWERNKQKCDRTFNPQLSSDQPPRKHFWQHSYQPHAYSQGMYVMALIRPNALQTDGACVTVNIPTYASRFAVARAWRTLRTDNRTFRQQTENAAAIKTAPAFTGGRTKPTFRWAGDYD